jgi:hypothetical protein
MPGAQGSLAIMYEATLPPDSAPADEARTLREGPDPASEMPVNLTMENIIDITGELEHLNELVMVHLERSGGFQSTAAYFTMVQPILDMLEIEIRVKYLPGMTINDMKLVVQDWIDREIATMK